MKCQRKKELALWATWDDQEKLLEEVALEQDYEG